MHSLYGLLRRDRVIAELDLDRRFLLLAFKVIGFMAVAALWPVRGVAA